MAENNNLVSSAKPIKAKIVVLPAIVLGVSIPYSFMFTTGIVIGYILCKIFCDALGIDEHNGEKVFLDIGKWKIHIHHWIMGLIVLAIVWVIDYFYLPTFFAGAVCGIIMQDIYDYNDWYKVIVRNDDYKGSAVTK